MSDTTYSKHAHATSRDYHPSLIRLQQNPPHPAGRRIVWGLALLLIFVIGWTYWGELDIVAVGEGRLIPIDRLKIVQPSEAGIIEAIRVREGDRVEAGQELIRLQGLQIEAETQGLLKEKARLDAEIDRLEAQVADLPYSPTPGTTAELARENRARYLADQNALETSLAEEQARLSRAEKELDVAIQQKSTLKAVVPYYRKREQALSQLLAKGGSTQLQIDDVQRERIEKEQELETQDHLIAAALANIELSQKKLSGIRARHTLDLQQRKQDVRARLEQLHPAIQKQQHREDLLSLRAPEDGILKQLATHTVGTVVQPGTILASLVPADTPLQAEIWLPNQDIGFVHEGQEVKLKLAAYPFQKYGMLIGKLSHISPDAQSTEEAQNAGTPNPMQAALRYRALVDIQEEALERNGNTYPLNSGMRVTAEIHLGKRTVAEYLLSPISQAWGEAGRER